MNSRHYVGKKRLVEWETIVHIVRREVEPLEYGGDIDGAKNVLEKLPQEDGLVLKKWGDVLSNVPTEKQQKIWSNLLFSKSCSPFRQFLSCGYFYIPAG